MCAGRRSALYMPFTMPGPRVQLLLASSCSICGVSSTAMDPGLYLQTQQHFYCHGDEESCYEIQQPTKIDHCAKHGSHVNCSSTSYDIGHDRKP